MEEQQHNIDELFRQSLGDYREAPPPAAWDAVERRLDNNGNRHPAFSRWPWIALLLLLMVSGAWYAMQSGRRGIFRNMADDTTRTAMHAIVQERDPASANYQHNNPHADLQSNASSKKEKAPGSATGFHGTRVNRMQRYKLHYRAHFSDYLSRRSAAPMQASGITTPNEEPAQPTPAPTKSSSGDSSQKLLTAIPPKSRQESRTNAQEKAMHSAAAIKSSDGIKSRAAYDIRERPAQAIPGTGKMRMQAKNNPGSNGIQSDSLKDPALSESAVVANKTSGKNHAPEMPVRAGALPGQNFTATEKSGYHSDKENDRMPEAASLHTVVRPFKSLSAQTVKPAAGMNASPDTSATGIGRKSATASKDPINNTVPASGPQLPAPGIVKTNKARNRPAATAPDRTVANTADTPSVINVSGGGAESAPDNAAGKKQRRRLKLNIPLSLEVLAGYEAGTQAPAPGRTIAALRLAMNISSRFSMGIQPAYRFGNVRSQDISGSQVFGNVLPVIVDSTFSLDSAGNRTNQYFITQPYDSIRTPSVSAGGKIWEIELPLLLSYQSANGSWRFYGGPSFNFGGKIASTTSGAQQTYRTERRENVVLINRQLPADTFEHYFGSPLPPVSGYSPAKAEDPASMRIGYTLGLGYQWRGIVLDASVHQQLTGYGNIFKPLQKIYGPYVRIAIGYRLFGPHPANRKAEAEKKSLQRL